MKRKDTDYLFCIRHKLDGEVHPTIETWEKYRDILCRNCSALLPTWRSHPCSINATVVKKGKASILSLWRFPVIVVRREIHDLLYSKLGCILSGEVNAFYPSSENYVTWVAKPPYEARWWGESDRGQFSDGLGAPCVECGYRFPIRRLGVILPDEAVEHLDEHGVYMSAHGWLFVTQSVVDILKENRMYSSLSSNRVILKNHQ